MDRRIVYLARVRDVYPDLDIQTVESHSGGQFNDILVVNEGLIFRFPKTSDAARKLATETVILRALQGRVNLPVPDPVYLGSDPRTGEPLFMGYRMIPGEPLWRETVAAIEDEDILDRLATQLAIFLRQLHGVAVPDLGLELPVADGVDRWMGMYVAFREELFGYIREDARRLIAREFEEFLGETRHFEWQPCLRHGDFGSSNILYDPHAQHISGVIDFGSAALGDPATDLAAVSGYGERLLEGFYPVYPDLLSTASRERAEFYRSTFALQQALWALRAGDQEEFQDGISGYV